VMLRSYSAHLRRGRIRARRAASRNRPRYRTRRSCSLQPIEGSAENVCLSGKTGSNRRRVKMTRLILTGRGELPTSLQQNPARIVLIW
jgi:methylaspartate ammonia-lyase